MLLQNKALGIWNSLVHNPGFPQMHYHIAGKFGGGKFGEFGESSVIRQTKTLKISTYY